MAHARPLFLEKTPRDPARALHVSELVHKEFRDQKEIQREFEEWIRAWVDLERMPRPKGPAFREAALNNRAARIVTSRNMGRLNLRDDIPRLMRTLKAEDLMEKLMATLSGIIGMELELKNAQEEGKMLEARKIKRFIGTCDELDAMNKIDAVIIDEYPDGKVDLTLSQVKHYNKTDNAKAEPYVVDAHRDFLDRLMTEPAAMGVLQQEYLTKKQVLEQREAGDRKYAQELARQSIRYADLAEIVVLLDEDVTVQADVPGWLNRLEQETKLKRAMLLQVLMDPVFSGQTIPEIIVQASTNVEEESKLRRRIERALHAFQEVTEEEQRGRIMRSLGAIPQSLPTETIVLSDRLRVTSRSNIYASQNRTPVARLGHRQIILDWKK